MRNLVVLVCVLVYFQGHLETALATLNEELQKLEPEEEECINELKLDKEAIQKLNSEQYPPDDNDDFNDFIFCYWQKTKLQNANGDMNYDTLKALLQGIMEMELSGAEPRLIEAVNKLIVSSIEYCQQNPPPKGITHGQTDVRYKNCVMKKLYDALPQ